MAIETASGTIATVKLFGYLSSMTFFVYTGIPAEQSFILWVLMILDCITWIAKQYTIDPQKITSHALWLGVVKKIGTLIAILTIAFAFKALNINANTYIEASLALVIMAEAYSIIQNIYTMRTGLVLPEYDVISILLKKLSDFIKEKIDYKLQK